MADRYQDRPFPADDYGRGGEARGSGRGESDPLAELARLIGQSDPFEQTPRPAPPRAQPQPRPVPANPYPAEDQGEGGAPAGGPPWMQRANIQRDAAREPTREMPRYARENPVEIPREIPRESPRAAPAPDYGQDYAPDYPSPVHPLQRYATETAAHEQDYQHEQAFTEEEAAPDPARYDDALFGQIENGAQDYGREPAYPDDPYAYQDGYEDEGDERVPRRRGGLMTVAAVLALAVIGTGAAFAYRTFVGAPRSGEPPIIKADNSPTKVVPAPSDGSGKVPDRMALGDGTEKIVPREEAPVDVNARAGGARVVFPPLNPNSNPPSAASVAPGGMPAMSQSGASANGTLPNSQPRAIRTVPVRGDQADASGVPVPPPAPSAAPKPVGAAKAAVARNSPANANASTNAPLSLSPQQAEPAPAAEPRSRMAATNPAPIAAAPTNAATAGGGSFLVQVSSQPSEAVAQASFRALQNKFPSVLGSQSAVIKRADLGGEKGVVYRAMVGPFGSREEAVQLCESLKSAGGQCFVPRN